MARQQARVLGVELSPTTWAVCQVCFHLFRQSGAHDFRLEVAILPIFARPYFASPVISEMCQVIVVGTKVTLALLACQIALVGLCGNQQGARTDDQSGNQQHGSKTAETDSLALCTVFHHIQLFQQPL